MRGGILTPWYQLGSEKGICAPNGSRASASSWPLGVTGFFAGAAALGAATGIGSAAGFASTFGLLSRLPTWSCPLYFFRMPSLWYFQNCLEASFPATLWRIFLPPVFCGQRGVLSRGEGSAGGTPPMRRGWTRLDHSGGLTWVVILELCQIVDILVDNDPKRVGRLMRRDVVGAERL